MHVPSFFQELEELKQKGLDTEGRILVSDRAHVVFDLHQLVDGLEEQELGKGSVGTVCRFRVSSFLFDVEIGGLSSNIKICLVRVMLTTKSADEERDWTR